VIFLQETQVTVEELVPNLRAISNNGYDRAIYIRGDARTSWDTMAQVLASVSSGGFTKLQLVTDTQEGRQRSAAGGGD
jgi:biopolymer transport protein TolR